MGNLIAETITQYRKKGDRPRAALAEAIGISESQLRELELGERLPSIPTLARVARFFHLAPEVIGQFVLKARGEAPGPKPRSR